MTTSTTGRTAHTHKITVYLSADELHQLDQGLADIRYILEGLDQNGVRSWVVERLREIR